MDIFLLFTDLCFVQETLRNKNPGNLMQDKTKQNKVIYWEGEEADTWNKDLIC